MILRPQVQCDRRKLLLTQQPNIDCKLKLIQGSFNDISNEHVLWKLMIFPSISAKYVSLACPKEKWEQLDSASYIIVLPVSPR